MKRLLGFIRLRLKNIVFSSRMFLLCEFSTEIVFFFVRVLNTDLCWFNFLSLVKLQLRIGYQTGIFAYENDEKIVSSGLRKLKEIEKKVIYAISHIKMGVAGPFEEEISLDTLFLTSFIYGTGGHTRLLQTYLSNMKNSQLLVTGRYSGRTYDSKLQSDAESFFPPGLLLLKPHRGRSFKSEVLGICRELVSLAPKNVVLFNHPADLGLLTASMLYAGKRRELPVIYYHHADDYMPFLGSVFSCHIDLDTNQDKKCSSVPCRELIRISTRNRVQQPEAAGFSKPSAFTVFSFAPLSKISGGSGKENDYAFLVCNLVNEGIRAVIVTGNGEGASLKNILEKNRCNMNLVDIDEDCTDISKYYGRVHAYLDTFPIGGGMSVVDGLSMGLPVMILDGENYQIFKDPVLSRFTFPSAGDILKYSIKMAMDGRFYTAERSIAHEIYRNYYSERIMVEKLSGVFEKKW